MDSMKFCPGNRWTHEFMHWKFDWLMQIMHWQIDGLLNLCIGRLMEFMQIMHWKIDEPKQIYCSGNWWTHEFMLSGIYGHFISEHLASKVLKIWPLSDYYDGHLTSEYLTFKVLKIWTHAYQARWNLRGHCILFDMLCQRWNLCTNLWIYGLLCVQWTTENRRTEKFGCHICL